LIQEIKVMAQPSIPRIERGRLYFQIGPVLLPTFAPAATAWFAAEAHRLDVVDVTGGVQ
jgi:hypothetical protein